MFPQPLILLGLGLYIGLSVAVMHDHGAAAYTTFLLGLLVGVSATELKLQNSRREGSLYRAEQVYLGPFCRNKESQHIVMRIA
ncbi:MAG: hypothetical protein Q9208_008604 [Pyrenodesmia sp. 3 TL-2023]